MERKAARFLFKEIECASSGRLCTCCPTIPRMPPLRPRPNRHDLLRSRNRRDNDATMFQLERVPVILSQLFGAMAVPRFDPGIVPSDPKLEISAPVERGRNTNHMPCHSGAPRKAASPESITT